MPAKSKAPKEIVQPHLLLVEGNDDERFFASLIRHLDLNQIQIWNLEGKDNLKRDLLAIKSTSTFVQGGVRSVAIVRDADDSAEKSFHEVRDALSQIEMPSPSETLKPTGDAPRVIIMILPDNNSPRMLEDLCLRAFADDPAIDCVDQYFHCLAEAGIDIREKNIPKAKIRAFLLSRLDPEGGVTLWLGSAVDQSWWPWDHPAFDEVKDFLRLIASD